MQCSVKILHSKLVLIKKAQAHYWQKILDITCN